MQWASETFGTTGSPERVVVETGLRNLARMIVIFAQLMVETSSSYWRVQLPGCSLSLELSGAVVVVTLQNELMTPNASTTSTGGRSGAGPATT
jgi:hypothetical protein